MLVNQVLAANHDLHRCHNQTISLTAKLIFAWRCDTNAKFQATTVRYSDVSELSKNDDVTTTGNETEKNLKSSSVPCSRFFWAAAAAELELIRIIQYPSSIHPKFEFEIQNHMMFYSVVEDPKLFLKAVGPRPSVAVAGTELKHRTCYRFGRLEMMPWRWSHATTSAVGQWIKFQG